MVAHANAPVTKAARERVTTNRTRLAPLRRPQASQSMIAPRNPRVPLFMDIMLAARDRIPVDSPYPTPIPCLDEFGTGARRCILGTVWAEQGGPGALPVATRGRGEA